MFTTEQLLEDIRLSCRLSPTDFDYTDSILLRMATSELRLNVLPWLISLNQNYGVIPVDIPVTAGKADYRMSNRAHGGTLKDLNYIPQGSQEQQLTHAVFDNLARGVGQPSAFVLLGNTIRLGPTPDGPGILRQYLNLKPSTLVLSTDVKVRTIVSVDSATDVTLDSAPAASSFVADVISQESPHDTLLLSVPASYSTSLTLPKTDGISPGDLVCVAGYSPVVQLPEELITLLVDSVALQYFMSMNFADQLQNATGRIDKLKGELAPLFSNRVPQSPQLINSPL